MYRDKIIITHYLLEICAGEVVISFLGQDRRVHRSLLKYRSDASLTSFIKQLSFGVFPYSLASILDHVLIYSSMFTPSTESIEEVTGYKGNTKMFERLVFSRTIKISIKEWWSIIDDIVGKIGIIFGYNEVGEYFYKISRKDKNCIYSLLRRQSCKDASKHKTL